MSQVAAALMQEIAALTTEVITMKSIVVRGVARWRSGEEVDPEVNGAFRRVQEIGPLLHDAKQALAAVTGFDEWRRRQSAFSPPAARLGVRPSGSNIIVTGLPPGWDAYLRALDEFGWLLIVRRPTQIDHPVVFGTIYDAVTALQAQVDPTVFISRDELPTT